MLCQPCVESPLDVGRLLGLRREAADVTATLQVPGLLEQLQVQALEALPFLGEPTTTEPGEHGWVIAASPGRDAVDGENSPRLAPDSPLRRRRHRHLQPARREVGTVGRQPKVEQLLVASRSEGAGCLRAAGRLLTDSRMGKNRLPA